MDRNIVVGKRGRAISPKGVLAALALACSLVAPLVSTDVGHAQVLGTIEFGTNYKIHQDGYGATVSVVGARTTFSPGERLAYVAYIPGGAGTKKMRVSFYLKQAGHLEFVSHHPFYVRNPSDTEFFNRYTQTDMEIYGIVRPGTYVMRFYRGKAELAEGTFTRTG